MFNYLKSLFGPKYKIGALESPVDNRNIPASVVLSSVEIPDDYISVLKFRKDQKIKPKCVGSSTSVVAGEILGEDLSDDDLYEQCKKQDGIPNIDGTYISVAAKIATNSGIATVEAYNTGNQDMIAESRAKHKMKGYVFVERNFEAICQAIFQKKAVVAGFSISSEWFRGIITKILSVIGGHAVILKGYKYSAGILRGQNSWVITWIGYIAGKFNPIVKNGDFEMLWDDYKDNIYDIVAFTPISPDVKEEAKKYTYRFMNTLRLGSSGLEVKQLQTFLGLKADGSFGKITQSAVMKFQKDNGLLADGIVGAGTRKILNINAKSLIDAWCEAIKIMEGAKPERNNPGNLRYIGQKNAINDRGFCKFDTYENGYNALKNILVNACTGKSSVYYPSMSLLDFYSKYAPSSDGNNPKSYATFVAKKLGCSITTKIVELL